MVEFLRYSTDAAGRDPRPYQRECAERAIKSLDGEKPTLLHIATGGGKTFVANNIVGEYLDGGDYALWITKDWWLLRQAATDIAQRKRGMARRLRRLGGDHREVRQIPSYSHSDRISVLYTTLQSFKRRLDARKLPSTPPALIVWDECHWGYNASSGKALMRWARERSIPVLGLTATPRFPDDFERACSHSFRELIDAGFLADYEPFRVRTGVRWEPRRHNNADFTDGSLRVLSENQGRNRQIVDEYVGKASFYGKTIFFACNIEHAELLASELKRNGVAARAIHSELPPEECANIITEFANSEVKVLVNVAKLTHGFSIPDIESVFLCRPTSSDILFSQMVGRGAHRSRKSTFGKSTFNLVEFTDNLTHFERVLHAREFFGSPAAGDARERERRSRRWGHKIDRGLEPTWTGVGDDVPAEVRGLWYRGQTFGVEFELASKTYNPPIPDDEYMRVGEALLEYLRERLGDSKVRSRPCGEYHEDETYDMWKVEPDRSVGWEVVSPKLEGQAGMIELHSACAALTAAVDDDDLGLHIDWRCGTHVHIGWDGEHAARALQLAHLLEPIFRSLVPPSRFAEFLPEENCYNTDVPNEYCRPVSDVYDVDDLDDETSLADVQSMARRDPKGANDGGRTIGLNVTPLFDGHEHVEVRLLGGTTEAGKLLPWLSLWMRVLWRADREPMGNELLAYVREPSAAFPDLDLGDVLSESVIGVPGEKAPFRGRLTRRQEEIFENWREHDELSEWLPRVTPHWELDVEFFLAKSVDPPPTTHDFDELDYEAQKKAVWSTLVGEGPLEKDRAIRLSAERLREQGWVYFERLREQGPLYQRIRRILQDARKDGADGWFDIPRNLRVRAFRRLDEMRDDDWRRCVVEALRSDGGVVTRNGLHYPTFEESKLRFGIERINLTDSVTRPINSAITGCIKRRFILRQGAGLVLNEHASE